MDRAAVVDPIVDVVGVVAMVIPVDEELPVELATFVAVVASVVISDDDMVVAVVAVVVVVAVAVVVVVAATNDQLSESLIESIKLPACDKPVQIYELAK